MSIFYTKEQLDYIKSCRKTMTTKQIANAFNARFTPHRNPKAIQMLCERQGWASPKQYRFEKGYRPWNDNTKGQGLTGANKGSFKTGNIPQNNRPIGSERICSKDHYCYIKTADPNVWKQKHIATWEAVNGPLPDGHVIRFVDGDITNFDIENLELASRHELLKYNVNGLNKAPAELQPVIKMVSKIQAALAEKQRGAHHG